MRRLFLAAVLTAACSSSAWAVALPVEEHEYLPREDTTTYRERSLNHQAPLTIEHPRLPRRTGGSAAIAGFCRDAGTIRRRGEDGRWVLRQRETCENVAPRTLWPGHTDPRPAWSDRPRPFREVVNTLTRIPSIFDKSLSSGYESLAHPRYIRGRLPR